MRAEGKLLEAMALHRSAGLEDRTMATADDLRRLALALDGTTEAPHFDRRAFKVARTYATLAADGRTANIRFTPDEQSFRCEAEPEAFAPLENAWGRQGWTVATLSKLDEPTLARALRAAWTEARAHQRCPPRARQP